MSVVERLVRKGGKIKIGGWVFQAEFLEGHVGRYVFVMDNEDHLAVSATSSYESFIGTIHDSPGKREFHKICDDYTFTCKKCGEKFCEIGGKEDDCPGCPSTLPTPYVSGWGV